MKVIISIILLDESLDWVQSEKIEWPYEVLPIKDDIMCFGDTIRTWDGGEIIANIIDEVTFSHKIFHDNGNLLELVFKQK